MSGLVLDASAALDFVFEEGDTAAVDGIIGAIAFDGAVVPQHWRLEVANGMATRLKRKVLTSAEARQLLARLNALNLTVDDATGECAWTITLDLAERYGLTTYDAAYLELALRRGIGLATFDGPLSTAAKAEGVPVNAI